MRNSKAFYLVFGAVVVLMLGAFRVSENDIKFGDKTGTDKTIEADVGATDNPKMRYNATTGNWEFSNNGTDFATFGSGTGGLGTNYISNPNFELNLDDWATFAEGAVTDPTTGSGGSPVNTVLSRTTSASEVLRGDASGKFAKAAADSQGEGFSIDFTIDPADANPAKILKIEADYKTTANYATGDLNVWVICDVGGTPFVVEPTAFSDGTVNNAIAQTNGKNGRLVATFLSPDDATDTDCRLTFMVPNTDALAWDFIIDEVLVGPGQISTGAVLTAWESFTPVFVNDTGITWSFSEARKRRNGESMELAVFAVATGTGSSGSALGLTIPDSLSTSTAVSSFAGTGFAAENGAGSKGIKLRPSGANTLQFRLEGGGTVLGTNIDDTVGGDYSNLAFVVSIPINEWSDTGIVNLITEQNLTEYSQYTPVFSQGTWTSTVATRRVGDSMQVIGQATLSSIAGATGDPLAVDFPVGLNFDTTKASNGSTTAGSFGNGRWSDSGAHTAISVYVSGTTQMSFTKNSVGATTTLRGTDLANGDVISWSATIPIAEYRAAPSPLVGFSLASEDQAGLVSTGAQTFSGEKKLTANATGACSPGNVCSANDLAGTGEACTTNCDACVVDQINYVRVGNVVTMGFRVAADPTVSGTFYRCDFNPPIASDFTTSLDVAGACTITDPTLGENGFVVSSAGGDTVNFSINNPSHTISKNYVCSATYVVK